MEINFRMPYSSNKSPQGMGEGRVITEKGVPNGMKFKRKDKTPKATLQSRGDKNN